MEIISKNNSQQRARTCLYKKVRYCIYVYVYVVVYKFRNKNKEVVVSIFNSICPGNSMQMDFFFRILDLKKIEENENAIRAIVFMRTENFFQYFPIKYRVESRRICSVDMRLSIKIIAVDEEI